MIDNKLYPHQVLVHPAGAHAGAVAFTDFGVAFVNSELLDTVEYGDRFVNLPTKRMLCTSYLVYKDTGCPGWEGWKFYGGYGKEED